MKTLLLNLNNILPVIFTAKVLIYKNSVINHLAELKYAKYISAFNIFLSNPGHYLLPLTKQVIKEAMGYELELELLFILFAGYFSPVKDAFTHNALIEKLRGLKTNFYNTPEGDLKLI